MQGHAVYFKLDGTGEGCVGLMVARRYAAGEILSQPSHHSEAVKMGDQTNDDGVDFPTVEQLEEELKADPTNLEIQEDLAQALLKRYIYEGGPEQDIEQLKRLLTGMPAESRSFYGRAYLAWLNHDDSDAVDKLCECAIQISGASNELLTSDDLYWAWVFPFQTAVPDGLWGRLAEAFSHSWPDSAVVLTLRGIAEDDSAVAVDYFVQALDRDETFWLAACQCGWAYADQKNWRAARGYYLRALKSETAASLPELHFALACCYGKIREYRDETRLTRLA